MKRRSDHGTVLLYEGTDLNHFLESKETGMECGLGNCFGPTHWRHRAVTGCDSCTEGLTLHLYARPSRTRDDYE